MKILVNSLSKYILKVRKSAMANDELKSTFLQPTTKLKEKVRGKDSMLYYLFHSSMLPVNSKWTSSYFCFDISYPMYQVEGSDWMTVFTSLLSLVKGGPKTFFFSWNCVVIFSV